jgi:hypothetical protein
MSHAVVDAIQHVKVALENAQVVVAIALGIVITRVPEIVTRDAIQSAKELATELAKEIVKAVVVHLERQVVTSPVPLVVVEKQKVDYYTPKTVLLVARIPAILHVGMIVAPVVKVSVTAHVKEPAMAVQPHVIIHALVLVTDALLLATSHAKRIALVKAL